jgi:methyltransferase (TIGR00027 family)
MIEGQPSTTALRVAMRRATHQLFDRPLVFEDPLAVAILEPEVAAALTRESDFRGEERLRAFMAVRSRYAEEQLRAAVERGVKQYVILGAGLDTFAYRNPYADLRVFEVDYPATQIWKRQRLEAAGIALPPGLRFAPVDFEKEALSDGLRDAGFVSEQRTFFAWLGVTPYLARETVFATLRLILAMCRGNGVVFDYSVPRSSMDAEGQLVLDALMKRVEAAGEPFQGFFETGELERELREMGYQHVEDLSSSAIDARYFHGRTDGLRVAGSFAHLLCALGALEE